MPQRTSFAKGTLPYPIFAADFDPYNRGYLVVGGGGGEGRSGVPNQISVLDISNRAAISIAAEFQLSRDEDSVQSLANLASKDGLITLAGINSSQADQNAGKNEHLRSFEIKYPPRKKQKTEKTEPEEKGNIEAIGRRSVFKQAPAPKSETYQRILRLSPAQKRESGSKRIGAIATGLAKRSEIVVFNATTSLPEDADILTRVELEAGAEAVDLDVAVTGENEFSVTYCTDYDICEQTFKYDFTTKKVEKTPRGPRRIHQMPFPDAEENPASRGKFRCLRFLDAQNVIALLNKPNKGGSELRIFHLYPTGPAAMLLQKSMPKRIKQSVSMDVCSLDVDKVGNRQIAVAVAGQDISIEVYTVNYQRNTDTFSRFQSYETFRDVHQHQMTKICFSPFHSPERAEQAPGPQYIRLASVSYGNTVVVDTFPLSPLVPKDKESRYVLSHPTDVKRRRNLYIVLFSFLALITAYVAQAYFNGAGTGMNQFLPPGAREMIHQPAHVAQDLGKDIGSSASVVIDSSVPTSVPGKQRLIDLISHPSDTEAKALVVRDDPAGSDVSIEVHTDQEAFVREGTEAKQWDELPEEQKRHWRARLVKTGRWIESEGETVLKGMLWSEYAGLVGQAAGAALREL